MADMLTLRWAAWPYSLAMLGVECDPVEGPLRAREVMFEGCICHSWP